MFFHHRGVASVSIRCLAIAAECLVTRQSQEEVLQIFEKIIKETGWRIAFLRDELVQKWGWNSAQTQQQQPETGATTTTANVNSLQSSSSLLNSALPAAPPRPRIPTGIVNPLMARADFSVENHPYQNHYVAPNNPLDHYQYGTY
jgi:hypothetical protein